MKRFFVLATVLSLSMCWNCSFVLASSLDTLPVYLQNDGLYIDQNNNIVEPSLVIKKREIVLVKKYLDLDKRIYIDKKDAIEGGNYQEVEVADYKFSYYIPQKEYGNKTGDSSQEIKYYKWNNSKLEDGSKDDNDLIYYVDSTRKVTERVNTKNQTLDANKDYVDINYTTDQAQPSGGAIYNYDKNQETIIGDFVNNSATTSSETGNYKSAYGGAIYNLTSEIKKIKGNFINNHVKTRNDGAYGGAIYNQGKINEIEGDFIGNYTQAGDEDFTMTVSSSAIKATGGAIYNKPFGSLITGIDNIKGNFIRNFVYSKDRHTEGGAIANGGNINGNIESDFIGNYAKSINENALGGAIYQKDTSASQKAHIDGDITGKFIGNQAISQEKYGYGGAIFNSGTINGNINADFADNYVESIFSLGGAIYNNGTIGQNTDTAITGDFTNNKVYATRKNEARGGVFYNTGKIFSSIQAKFTNNSAKSNDKYAQGGAIYNSGTISIIKNSSFYNNSVEGKVGQESSTKGGAIYSTTDLNIKADDNQTSEFKGNYTKVGDTITNNAIFMKTQDSTLNLTADEQGKIVFYDSISGNTNGYNINILSNDKTGTVSFYNDIEHANIVADNVLLDFADGVIKDYDILSLNTKNDTKFRIDLSLKGNENKGSSDKFIILDSSNSLGVIKINKINFVDSFEDDTTRIIKVIDANDSNVRLELDADVITKEEIKDTIYSNTIVSEPDTINVVSVDGQTDNAIEITGKIYNSLDLINSSNDPQRNFVFKENDSYTVISDLSQTGAGILNIKGVEGTFSVINGNDKTLFNLDNETTLNLNNIKITNAKSVAIGSNDLAVINIADSVISNNAQGIKIAGDINILGNSTIENNGTGIETTSAITLDAKGKIININDELKGDKVSIKQGLVNLYKKITSNETIIEDANVAFKDDNILNGSNLTINESKNGSTPTLNFINNVTSNINYNLLTLNNDINLKVDVDLKNEKMDTISANNFVNDNNHIINVAEMILLSDALKDETNIQFADENLRQFVTTSVSEVAYSPVYKYRVQYNKDSGQFNFIRHGGCGSNSYLDLNPSVLAAPSAANIGGYLNQLQSYDEAFYNLDNYMLLPKAKRLAFRLKNKYAVLETEPVLYEQGNSQSWMRPYTTIESVRLKNGPKVNNVAYGSYFGGETQIKEIGKGWEHQWGAYVGYNGSRQSYSGISMYQNGGTFGLSSNLYKGNFFQGLTINVGGSGVYANTFNGNDSFAMLNSGVATKLGYNFEFKEGKFIIQPSYLMSYSFVKTSDYTDSANVRINSDPLHAIQMEPGLRFIVNSKSGWQSYLGASMIFNIMNGSNYKINNISLADMSIKPFVKYGLGIRRIFSENLTGFLQAYVTNGGRNGIGMQGGLNWAIGKNRKEKL